MGAAQLFKEAQITKLLWAENKQHNANNQVVYYHRCRLLIMQLAPQLMLVAHQLAAVPSVDDRSMVGSFV